MKNRYAMTCLLALTIVLGAMPLLRASDPAGCYAIVERVVLEPSDVEPTTIQVWGAFALSGQPFTGNTYGNVQKATCTQVRRAAKRLPRRMGRSQAARRQGRGNWLRQPLQQDLHARAARGTESL